jgi:pimeloyl-ACP methyl ester carboxylesterase
MSVSDLEASIPDQLTPVNRSLAYSDLGVVDATKGTLAVQVQKKDTNPMLLEGLMAVPEDDYASMRLAPAVSVVTDPDTLDCSEKTPLAGKDQMYVSPAGNDAHADLTQEELTDLAASGVEDVVPDPAGGYRPHYDPGIGNAFRPGRVYDTSLWEIWDAVSCPVLLLRGAASELLLPRTADEMTRRGPRAERVEIPACGHAPALMDADQIRIVTDWLGPAR